MTDLFHYDIYFLMTLLFHNDRFISLWPLFHRAMLYGQILSPCFEFEFSKRILGEILVTKLIPKQNTGKKKTIQSPVTFKEILLWVMKSRSILAKHRGSNLVAFMFWEMPCLSAEMEGFLLLSLTEGAWREWRFSFFFFSWAGVSMSTVKIPQYFEEVLGPFTHCVRVFYVSFMFPVYTLVLLLFFLWCFLIFTFIRSVSLTHTFCPSERWSWRMS